VETYEAEVCDLAPSSFFEQCLVELPEEDFSGPMPDDPYPMSACADANNWVEGCEPAPPAQMAGFTCAE